ncbi:MAG: hypothetical protein AMR96_07025 [Candidatus Adiutrix intracellularis]|jgi:UDP-N-acetylglucosamine--N-acetylmuramyl-(pentapeptide) pyrophosphoryl-undecaprenol N-acetylglucosamine transferase|nr:MAG: hypothetical protein AMR96_07025 [Candidatus Adiutrix intracellularis]MDR2827718.1 undecaprenyldiphospho-muramoylpentapeptide beta-N-acetylglucosaminyltransferase [Candidatus Adiutrix intracellularis]
MSFQRFILAAGGTGGHLWPALSLALALRKIRPEMDFLFIGAGKELEARIVDSAGFKRVVLKVSGLKGLGLLNRLKGLGRCLVAFLEALWFLKSYKPQLCFGAGGYVTVPVGLAAWVRGVPLIIHEQNSRPGLSNKFLGLLSQRVMLAFEEAAGAFPLSKIVVTGNPIRPEIAALNNQRRIFNRGSLVILVTGGSQGARGLNRVVAPAVVLLHQKGLTFQLIHQTGAADLEQLRSFYQEAGLTAEVSDFFQDMPGLYSRVNLVVSRAGAITVTELTAARLPSVLVPLPTATDDHQMSNARHLEAAGAAVIQSQLGLTSTGLAALLETLLVNPSRLAAMSEAAGDLFRPGAAERMAAICLELTQAGEL